MLVPQNNSELSGETNIEIYHKIVSISFRYSYINIYFLKCWNCYKLSESMDTRFANAIYWGLLCSQRRTDSYSCFCLSHNYLSHKQTMHISYILKCVEPAGPMSYCIGTGEICSVFCQRTTTYCCLEQC